MTQDDITRAFASQVYYPMDCARIQSVATERLGVTISLDQAETIWEWHSENSAAGWLRLESDDQIECAISSFVNNALT